MRGGFAFVVLRSEMLQTFLGVTTVFSIFFSGCKQRKSLHFFVLRCKITHFY